MTAFELDHFALSNFEGTLDFLLCLIQKEEIDIYDVSIQNLLQQFIEKSCEWEKEQLDKGAEFIGIASYLVWLKSKTLLPRNDDLEEWDLTEEEKDPRFEMIHHLLDYCRFKRAAKELGVREKEQQNYYWRGIDLPQCPKLAGVDHLSLTDLSLLFQQLIVNARESRDEIQDEIWSVSDKMEFLRALLVERPRLFFTEVFQSHQCKLEMIVIFLAILELIKEGRLAVILHEQQPVFICQLDPKEVI